MCTEDIVKSSNKLIDVLLAFRGLLTTVLGCKKLITHKIWIDIKLLSRIGEHANVNI